MAHTIYNTTDGPLIVDTEGHSLGGRERMDVDSVGVEPIKSHLEAGRMIETPANTTSRSRRVSTDTQEA